MKLCMLLIDSCDFDCEIAALVPSKMPKLLSDSKLYVSCALGLLSSKVKAAGCFFLPFGLSAREAGLALGVIYV